MNRKEIALLGMLLAGPALLGGCAAQTGAIRMPPKEARNYQLIDERKQPETVIEKASSLDFDQQVEKLAKAAYGPQACKTLIQALKDKDGNDIIPSALDIQVFSQRNGIAMYPPKVVFEVPLADENLLYKNSDKEDLRQIIESGSIPDFLGGSSLYIPDSARIVDKELHMDITHIPKAKGNVSASRFSGAKGSLDSFLYAREYDKVREFDIFQRGKLFDEKKKVLNAKFYTFSDVDGIVSLKRDISSNGFRISPYFLHSQDMHVLERYDGKEPDFEKLREIGYIDEESLRLLRYGEALALTAGAGAVMHATPVGWFLTASLGTYLYKNTLDFQDVSVFTSETDLDVPKRFNHSELSDLINPNIGSTADMPKVIVPVYYTRGGDNTKVNELLPVGLAVYTFPQYGVQDMRFQPDGSVAFEEQYKRMIFTGKNVAATALIVGTYHLGKRQYDDNKKVVQEKCPECGPGGGQTGGPGVVPPGGGSGGGSGVVNPPVAPPVTPPVVPPVAPPVNPPVVPPVAPPGLGGGQYQ